MPITKNYSGSGKNCCVYSKNSSRTAGLGRIFNKVRPSPLDNKYVVGSGVGAQSMFVKRALKRRANNKANGTACCPPAPPPLSWATARTMSEYNYLYAKLGYIDISTAGGKEFFKQKLLDAFPHPANLTTPIIVLSGGSRYNVVVNAFLSVALDQMLPDPGVIEADSFLRTNHPAALQYNYFPADTFLVGTGGTWTGYLHANSHTPSPPTPYSSTTQSTIVFVRQ